MVSPRFALEGGRGGLGWVMQNASVRRGCFLCLVAPGVDITRLGGRLRVQKLMEPQAAVCAW
jgi:hypothetical protein